MVEKSIFEAQPLMNIQWIDVELLSANDYNPNVVMSDEMKLLAYSILTNGWIQPLLVNHSTDIKDVFESMPIIDGFHRFWLSVNNVEIRKTFKGKVPCCVFNLDKVSRMLMTVRINRAKGSHVAAKMHDLVTEVFNSGMSKQDIAKQIGATSEEITLLLQENVFTKLDIKNHKYSNAWIPKP